MLRIDSSTATINLMPDGVWERGSVYSVLGWQLFTGVWVLIRWRWRVAGERPRTQIDVMRKKCE
ncbi:MAG: hypothetical protein JWR37_1225 [Mycobacterium sp.]|nr:hypothetical protein [Mycobacterium sp.]